MKNFNFLKSFSLILLLFLGLNSAWGQITVSYDFSQSGAESGFDANPPIPLDSNIGFASFKNNGTSNPGIFSNQLRLYQYTSGSKGGSIKLYASNSVIITSIKIYASGTTGPAKYSVDGIGNTDLSFSSGTYTINSINATDEVEFWCAGTTSGQRIYIDSFEVTYQSASSDPTLFASPTAISGLDYVEGSGPSPADSFTLSASSWDDSDVDLLVDTDFEISENGTEWTDEINLTAYDGTEKMIYTRLKSGLSIGDYSGSVLISGGTSDDVIVNLSGTVEEVPEPFNLPYFNGLRNTTDWNQAISDGFVFDENITFQDAAGGYVRIPLNSSFESPAIDFSQLNEIIVSFDMTTFGGDSGQQLTLFISNDNGANYTSINTFDTPSNYGTFTENIDLSEFNGTLGKIKFEMTDGSAQIRFRDLNLELPTIIWTDGAWSNETGPTIDDDAVIDSGFTIADTESLEAKNLTVTENGNVTIQDGGVLTLSGKLTNEAAANSFVIENGGNFIQNQDYTTDDNSGEITVERNSNEIVRLDYTMWSSPVKGQELQAFSPETLPNRIYTYETNSGNESTNGAYVEVPSATADFTQGKGYLFRAPNNWEFSESSETGAPYTGSFVGIPSNGNISVSTYSGGYTSIGNPYPSNIDPETLMNQNSGIGSLYFWNNPDRIETEPGSGEYTYTGTKYITFAGGSFSDPAYNGTSISVGQGFIVFNSENTVNFDNTMRVSTNESFFKTNEIENNRFWIQLNDGNGNKLNTMLVNYRTGATNGFDNQVDAEFFGYDGSAIFNTIEDKNYIIQGRALPFADDDVVPLGFKADEAGKFTVSISQFDGLFENQTIYLKDNKFGIIHNLTESMYEFESAAGEFKERFEIVYKENETMGIDDLYNSAVSIYKHKENFVVETKDSPIQSIQVFDLQGRLMLSNKQMNTMHYEFKIASKGVFVIHVTTGNGEIATKKIINQ